MIKIIVCGARGKMGSRILNLALQDKSFEIIAGIEKKNHQDINRIVNGYKILDNLEEIINKTDVVIDFTNPEATLQNSKIVSDAKKCMIIGTTGFSEHDFNNLKNTVKNIPTVISPNMSLGVNLLFDLVKKVASIIPDYDIEIIELHHNQKKDAPSGTANKLAEIICKQTHRDINKDGVYGRVGIVGARKKQEIGIFAVRAGDIVGEHTVIFAGNSERIEIIHRAHSRDTFAKGALQASKWIINKKPGIYSMSDVLEL